MVFIKTYDKLPFDKREILRYAGCRNVSDTESLLLNECVSEAEKVLSYKVCYSLFNITVNGDACDFGAFMVDSKDLAKNLCGCRRVCVFAATLSVGIDRLITKAGAVSPAKALMFDAIGTGQIETLCDTFCTDLAKEYGAFLRPRFSPGYGDLDLSFQKDVFSVLNCQKHIGLTVTDSLLMSPSKSVTAILGLCEKGTEVIKHKCDLCGNKECELRGEI